jgi:alanine racemase
MGALGSEELPVALAAGADIVAWSREFVDAAGAAGAHAEQPVRVHVKLDTGMGRLGTRELPIARAVAEAVAATPALELAGAMTHFATADADDDEFMAEQLARYRPFVEELRRAAPGVVVHAANSAATLRDPATHFDLVRCGIAVYGCDPANVDPWSRGLEPALALRSYVAAIKQAHAGDSAGYGRTFVATRDTWLATLPIGYGDGVRRALSNNAGVLVGERRRPLVGNVSMDNITVDLGPEPDVEVGEPAWLIGGDAGEAVTAEELAQRIGTINYEILCGISRRVPRVYHRDGAPA